MRLVSLLVLFLVGFPVASKAQTETVLYEFGNTPTDGYEPSAPLLIDSSGNLFGTTSAGGTSVLCPDPLGPSPCGTIFELVNSSGKYTEKVLYNFTGPPGDGRQPLAGLIMDSSGNLYGTTGYGGSGLCGATTCGTAFELVKSSSGYTERVIYMFNGFEGGFPLPGLIVDSSGNLYGTTNGGGAYGYGTVFELVNSSGNYTEKLLYSFGASASDGVYPLATLIMDSAGNLFGTTIGDGGAFRCGLTTCGTVFELIKSPSGYTERVLYMFGGSDGANPLAGLITDASGNLYGTTYQGGGGGATCQTYFGGCGTAFKLSHTGKFTVLHSFTGGADGGWLFAPLAIDAKGNLYGTANIGGIGDGTVFKITP